MPNNLTFPMTVTAAPAPPPPPINRQEGWDTKSVLPVLLAVRGMLGSASESEVENGGVNTAFVGNELVGFATATPTGPLAYNVSDLLRGRRGTATNGHVSGERFVLVTDAVERVVVADSLVGKTVLVKVVGAGDTLGAVAAQSVVIPAPNRPYATAADLNNLYQTQTIPLLAVTELGAGSRVAGQVLADLGHWKQVRLTAIRANTGQGELQLRYKVPGAGWVPFGNLLPVPNEEQSTAWANLPEAVLSLGDVWVSVVLTNGPGGTELVHVAMQLRRGDVSGYL